MVASEIADAVNVVASGIAKVRLINLSSQVHWLNSSLTFTRYRAVDLLNVSCIIATHIMH